MSIATLFPQSTATLVQEVKSALSGPLEQALAAFAQAAGGWSQHLRLLRLHTPLGADVLMAERASVHESLLHEAHSGEEAGLRISLQALSTSTHLELKQLIGQPAHLELLLADGQLRCWSGHITEAALLGSDGGLARYQLVIEPWLAALRHRQDAWVFQDQTVMQIIDEVFADYQGQGTLQPAWRWELADAQAYPARSLCAQYQESDLDFVLRLLAEEGLFAWWEHPSGPQGGPTLVLADHNPACVPNAQPLVRFTQTGTVLPADAVHRIRSLQATHTAALALASADYRSLSLRPASQTGQGPALDAALRLEDVPGSYAYADTAQGERLSRCQMEALDALRQRWCLSTSLRQAAPGSHFVLRDSPDASLAHTPLLSLRCVHTARNNLRADIQAGLANLLGHAAPTSPVSALPNDSDEPLHRCVLWAQPLAVPVRPCALSAHSLQRLGLHLPEVRLLARPRIEGVQTALVVGDGANAVHTERDHRIKVQLHWQRGGQSTHRLNHAAGSKPWQAAPSQRSGPSPGEGSPPDSLRPGSAPGTDAAWTWVRVAERQAGANWGSVFTPRVGQEVVLGFVGGNIDRPVVLGSVFNGQGQPNAQGNQVAAGSAGAVGSAPQWFPGDAGAHAHPQALNGFKSQALDTSQHGLGGHNQLVLDASAQQARLELASTSAATRLQLGHLLQQTDNQRLAARGHGLDLATSAWGAVRAASGLLLSTHGQSPSTASGQQMQVREPLARLEQGQALLHTLAHSAQAHHAKLPSEPSLPAQDSAQNKAQQLPVEQAHHAALSHLAELAEQGDADHGGAGTVAAWGRPDLVLAAPGGIVQTTPAHSVSSAGQHSALVAGGDIQHLAQASLATAAKDGLVLYTYGKASNPHKPNAETGIALHAASGTIQTQSQSGPTHLTADATVQVSSTNAHIHISAPQHLLLAATGAGIRIQSGKISLTAPGSISFKAGMKELTGPGSVGSGLNLAKAGRLFDEQFVIRDETTGSPMCLFRYKIINGDGQVLAQGTTDDQGRTVRVHTASAEQIQIIADN